MVKLEPSAGLYRLSHAHTAQISTAAPYLRQPLCAPALKSLLRTSVIGPNQPNSPPREVDVLENPERTEINASYPLAPIPYSCCPLKRASIRSSDLCPCWLAVHCSSGGRVCVAKSPCPITAACAGRLDCTVPLPLTLPGHRALVGL